jgi:hypothetical protein
MSNGTQLPPALFMHCDVLKAPVLDDTSVICPLVQRLTLVTGAVAVPVAPGPNPAAEQASLVVVNVLKSCPLGTAPFGPWQLACVGGGGGDAGGVDGHDECVTPGLGWLVNVAHSAAVEKPYCASWPELFVTRMQLLKCDS